MMRSYFWYRVWLHAEEVTSYYLIQWWSHSSIHTLITKFMGPTWSPSRANRTQVGPMLAPQTLPPGYMWHKWKMKLRVLDIDRQCWWEISNVSTEVLLQAKIRTKLIWCLCHYHCFLAYLIGAEWLSTNEWILVTCICIYIWWFYMLLKLPMTVLSEHELVMFDLIICMEPQERFIVKLDSK